MGSPVKAARGGLYIFTIVRSEPILIADHCIVLVLADLSSLLKLMSLRTKVAMP